MPEGFCSNIADCIDLNEKKIRGLKSHDYHIILEYLLPLATRGLIPEDVYDAVVNLSKFFRLLCYKSLNKCDLDQLQLDIVITLCKLEKIFPPSFFDIMVHLPVHLAFETYLGGPVHYRWMYPIEQYMGTLKNYLRNNFFSEGSISESYLVNESISLCARYLEDQDPPRTSVRDSTLSVFICLEELSKGISYTYEPGDRERAHSYILKNFSEAESIYNEFKREYDNHFIPIDERDRCYIAYFKTKIFQLGENISEDLEILGSGPTCRAKRFVSCRVNGYKFNIERHDEGLTTQNSGFTVLGNNDTETLSYYGVLTNIIQIEYFSGRRVILFKCKWFDVHSGDRRIKIDKHGFISVNVNRTLENQNHKPFILASQAKQVFYVPYMASRPGWKIVTTINSHYSNV
ncbi:uncharacterized protein LOC124927061 [Impatiens glandulifera]|uniref:uncharacterized protein LOC124927061 n=1 Tax=Impatiens glandulifera TaxID=253017 RepID=UPI001FB11D97|nr:uncharacterized protein LOC124927061 [Impatiens glandulifera]